MEFLFEFLFELIFEGTFAISKNKKVSKIIRYPLIVIIILLFLGVDFLIFFTGILAYSRINNVCGLLFIILGIVFLISTIVKLKNTYLKKKSHN